MHGSHSGKPGKSENSSWSGKSFSFTKNFVCYKMSELLEKQDCFFDCQDCQVEGKHSFLKEKGSWCNREILFICYSNMNCEMPFSGRIHSAVVSGINLDMHSLTVEWYEKGETKGKEVCILV